jgi:phosphoribosylformylglycinamidine cyclo-ligase
MTAVNSYAAAGVDVAAGERAVALMRAAVQSTQRAESVGDFGGFAGLFDASRLAHYRRPLLATSTDGVGTKVAIAQALQRYDTIGIDLVAMIVDDLVVCGAEPLFLTDYIATGSVVPERIAAIVSGIAEGCRQAGCALLGGETAEHPGLMAPDDFDLAGAGTGVVEADQLLGPARVQVGDHLVAMAASGLHANGFSLVRAILGNPDGSALNAQPAGLPATLGALLLEPTRIYAQDCLALAAAGCVHAFSHITGGGLAANIARVLPEHCTAVVERGSWTLPPLISYLGERGSVDEAELERTFNMGVGMVAVVPPDHSEAALQLLAERGLRAWICGEVRQRGTEDHSDGAPKGGHGGVAQLHGTYCTMAT